MIKDILKNRGFSIYESEIILNCWLDIDEKLDINIRYNKKYHEIEIQGFSNRLTAYRRFGQFTEKEIEEYIDECMLLLKNIKIRKKISEINKDFE